MKKYPKISVVTPSYNQGRFLEKTILSVISQNYPNLEYIIIDGGSNDDSVDIIKKYDKHISYWISERDQGHYAAVNKGFDRSTGDVMAWINSDDMYCNWAFKTVAEIFEQNKNVEWLSTLFPLLWDSNDLAVACFKWPGYSRDAFYEGRYGDLYPRKALNYIQQESTFWRRSLWDRSGGKLSGDFPLAGDFELWARFFQEAELYGVPVPLAGFRMHSRQRSHQIGKYLDECASVLKRYRAPRITMMREALRYISYIPVLNRLVNKTVGYTLFSVECDIVGKTFNWIPKQSRKLF